MLILEKYLDKNYYLLTIIRLDFYIHLFLHTFEKHVYI